jgi:hypothetical protein
MRLYMLVFCLALLVVFATLNVIAVVTGFIRHRIYYEPNCPPIDFNSHPVRFILCVLIELAVTTGCIVGAVKVASMMLDGL